MNIELLSNHCLQVMPVRIYVQMPDKFCNQASNNS